jgi:hypothetical protein
VKPAPSSARPARPARWCAGLAVLWLAAACAAADASPEQFFERTIHPLLREHCFACHSHGADKIKGGLVLDSLSGLLTGGDSGPAIVPGRPEESLLLKAVRHENPDLQMPPLKDSRRKLSHEEVSALTAWIKAGAVWPGAEKSAGRPRGKITDEDRAWWAFQPLKNAAPPQVAEAAWRANPIDRFVRARLEREGLRPAPEAGRRALARRLYFDLTGLPPSPEELDAFVNDPAPDAVERLVDRLLASPRYGERWARHWLDLVRYADSDGYRIDDFRPDAWRYRDYVIRAFNADKPYDRFVREQLAGDEFDPQNPEALVATGYLRHWIYEYNNRDVVGQWATILNDITDTTGDVFLGLGMQCARCHDHKFDPILQKDYFRLQAFFAPILPREDLDVATTDERAEHESQLARWKELTADARAEMESIETRYRQKAMDEALSKFPEETQALIRKPVAERTPLEHQLAELGYRQVDYEFNRLHTKFKGEDKERYLALQKQLAAFDKDKPPPLPRAPVVTDVGATAPPVSIPKKGGAPVEPGYLTLMDARPVVIPAVSTGRPSTGRRSELARWLTRPENPLTTRVIVNRVWQHHFGRGLVGTPSDFGRLGEKPSHPELLDWLARRFVEDGWSFKQLHRLIVTSQTYRQASVPADTGAGAQGRLKDPENRLLWRGPARRLDAEQVRDAFFAVSGELDAAAGGPAVNTDKPRRSIYTKVLRNTRDPLLDVFDAPQHFSSVSARDTTTTPVQSLLLLNSQFMLQRARALAARLRREHGDDETRLVTTAHRLAFGREPESEERQAALAFLREQQGRIDPLLATSASADFLADKIPYRDGRAAVMAPRSSQERLTVPASGSLPPGDFTIEAFIVLRSLYEDASVRTIAAHWSGRKTDPGWAFGVTSRRSARKPQTLVLQLTGHAAGGTNVYEPVFSDLHIHLNKPYFVAASVRLGGSGEPAVTFFAKDLSNDDEPMQSAMVSHHVTGGARSRAPFVIGGRGGDTNHLWDGLIDDVRLSSAALRAEQLLLTAEAVTDQTCGFWQFEQKPSVFKDSSPRGNDIQPRAAAPAAVADRRFLALADFCHVLLNASEFLYVD